MKKLFLVPVTLIMIFVVSCFREPEVIIKPLEVGQEKKTDKVFPKEEPESGELPSSSEK